MIRLDKASEIFGKYKKYRKTNINMRKNIKNMKYNVFFLFLCYNTYGFQILKRCRNEDENEKKILFDFIDDNGGIGNDCLRGCHPEYDKG